MRRRRWPALLPFLLLAGVTAALGLHLQDRLAAPSPTPAIPSAGADAVTPPPAEAPTAAPPRNALEAPQRHTFSAVVERNLFARDRRAPPRPTPDAAGPTRTPAELEARLTGVVLGGGAGRAILYDMKEETVARLEIGDRLRGWRLIAVDANSATFQAGSQSRTLSLEFVSNSDGAAVRAGDGPRATPQRAARSDSPGDGRSLRAIRRGHMGGLDRDPARSLLNVPERQDGRPRRANRRPDVPDSRDFD